MTSLVAQMRRPIHAASAIIPRALFFVNAFFAKFVPCINGAAAAHNSRKRRRLSVTKQQYGKLAKQTAPHSPLLRDCIWAFCVGGALCALGQVLGALWQQWMPQQQARTLGSMSLIALSALLTATHCYAPIAKRAGAGTLVPITGFANAISCAAIEFKRCSQSQAPSSSTARWPAWCTGLFIG